MNACALGSRYTPRLPVSLHLERPLSQDRYVRQTPQSTHLQRSLRRNIDVLKSGAEQQTSCCRATDVPLSPSHLALSTENAGKLPRAKYGVLANDAKSSYGVLSPTSRSCPTAGKYTAQARRVLRARRRRWHFPVTECPRRQARRRAAAVPDSRSAETTSRTLPPLPHLPADRNGRQRQRRFPPSRQR